MSLGNDFLSLIELLWDIEEFDMWYPKEHSSLAYLLDRLHNTAEYEDTIIKWLIMAKRKDANNFAWSVTQTTLKVIAQDERISDEHRKKFVKWGGHQEELFNEHCMLAFGFIPEKYVPDWFFALFHTYITVAQAKRENAIINYCKEEHSMPAAEAKAAYDKLYTQYDILNEFYFFVKNKRLLSFFPLTVERVSAQKLVDSAKLTPLAAYNYLVYLRESPKEALEKFEKGLPLE